MTEIKIALKFRNTLTNRSLEFFKKKKMYAQESIFLKLSKTIPPKKSGIKHNTIATIKEPESSR